MESSKSEILKRTLDYVTTLLTSFEKAQHIMKQGPIDIGLLIEAGGSPILHNGVAKRNTVWLFMMIKHGADLEAFDENGETPLEYSLRLPREEEKSFAVILHLLKLGARYYAKDKFGRTVFCRALIQSHTAFLEAYSDARLPLNEIDEYGNSLLQLAIFNQVPMTSLNWLISHGTFWPMEANIGGMSAMQMAISLQRDDYICAIFKALGYKNFLQQTQMIIMKTFPENFHKTYQLEKYNLLIENARQIDNQAPSVTR
jgi:ankyrin repeat protein